MNNSPSSLLYPEMLGTEPGVVGLPAGPPIHKVATWDTIFGKPRSVDPIIRCAMSGADGWGQAKSGEHASVREGVLAAAASGPARQGQADLGLAKPQGDRAELS